MTEIYKPSLNVLELGTVPLSVPIENGVVQVALLKRKGLPMGGLVVGIESDLISLSREDGQLLQIDYNDEPVGPPATRRRTRLLRDPISKVVLDRIRPEGVWLPEDENLITDPVRFNAFLTHIFWSAYKQQHPAAKVAEILEILDRSREF